MLAAIGLDGLQESAYRALVALGAAEVGDLAHRLAVSAAGTEEALRRLEARGLAARSPARAGRWVAAPPGVALAALLARQRQDLERAELAAARLAEEYRADPAEPAAHDLVEVVTGASAVAHRRRQLELAATGEIRALVTGVPAAAPGKRSGVSRRVVAERAVLDLPGGVGVLAELGGAQGVRVADRVPMELVVADRALAMVPLTGPGAEPAALVVHASELLESLTGVFEVVWREALPLRTRPAGGTGGPDRGTPAGPDATDLEILSLLLAGMTDASAAKQLELGLRTVQRRVRGLMDLTGATTRLQLGWHAYERGWVTRDASA
ncbi:helix-turn-helix domain-containing protein [Streptomyces sp. NPDC050856]|uniref:helix-turn-helix domain-containing protein n=1 Tax=Streptomyces sp. NPDC050856 TaxID=3154939 RepID=UPI0033E660A3